MNIDKLQAFSGNSEVLTLLITTESLLLLLTFAA
jgi:hypothetical protein